MPSKNPTNFRHGGVGLFFKNSLPIKIRDDLSFEESIVVELKFGRCYIEVLPSIILLQSSWTSCQILPIYIPKSKMEIHMHLFLLGIDFSKTTNDMGVHQQTKLGLTTFVKSVKKQLKMPT